MNAVSFDNTIDEVQQEWFTKAVYEMSNAERMRLIVFITGLEFFGGSHISVLLLDWADEPCLQANIYLASFSYLHTNRMKPWLEWSNTPLWTLAMVELKTFQLQFIHIALL